MSKKPDHPRVPQPPPDEPNYFSSERGPFFWDGVGEPEPINSKDALFRMDSLVWDRDYPDASTIKMVRIPKPDPEEAE